MRGIQWMAVVGLAMLSAAFVACSSDDDGGGVKDRPASVLTATALASDATEQLPGDATPDPGGGEYEGESAADFLDFVLLKPADITSLDWVIQSDETTDNEAAAAADPEHAESIDRCGRLLGRTITNFPPDSVAAFFNGTTLAYFSQGTLFETADGAKTCSEESAARLVDCPALARTFGGVFANPDGAICEPVPYDQIADGSVAAKVTGQTDAGGTSIDLTILVVSFRDHAATYAVGMAVSGIEPPMEELQPYVDLVLQRSQEAQAE